MQSKYAKMNLQEIPFIDRNVLEFFCVLLYSEFISNLHENVQVAYKKDTNAEY